MKKLKQAAIQAVYALESALGYAITQDADWNAKDIEAVESAITNLREALDQHKPHEECECSACLNYFTDKAHEEALAEQAEQEPVGEVLEGGYEVRLFDRLPEETPLYAAPVQQVDLTDDELNALWYGNTKGGWFGLFRAVIAKFKEKNRG